MIEKIQRHPHIMAQLVDFTNLLQSKGVDVSGKKPSFMQVVLLIFPGNFYSVLKKDAIQ